ncbi:MAG TPA: hypothetical protein VM032_02435 [Vicinamibacterales bacterium]|nr:hypothetical protein [Vicinamibacterales bacterium]
MRALWLALVVAVAPTPVGAQQDPLVGNWRGTLKTAAGTESPIIITIARTAERYSGSTTGLSEGADVALRKVEAAGTSLSIEAAAESRLGLVVLAATLTAQATALDGEGTLSVGSQRFPISLTLRRRARADVAQHQVDQTVDYFVGRWKFDYIGGEYPPLSPGNRQASVTFARVGNSAFVSGTLQGDSYGSPFEHRLSIGVDPEADVVVLAEKHQDGTELLSLGNWHSPLAVVFVTSPLVSGGKIYQLKRVFSILSESAFDVTEEFSVDGGPFRRLGAGHYTRQ